jgi:hypothetical protein
VITYQLRYFGFDRDIPHVAEALDLPGMSFEEAIFLVEEAADPDKIVCVTTTPDAVRESLANLGPCLECGDVELDHLYRTPDPSPPAVIHIADRAGTLPTPL